jgi:SPP1 gp7 family putative phage head morphogenesis protein
MPRQDPRLNDAVKNVNEDIHDRVISHMLFLERLKTQEANDLINKLDQDVLPDVLDRIEQRVEQGLSETGTVRAQELAAAIGTMAGRIKNESIASLQDDLRELAEDEVNWQVGAIREAIDVDIDMATPAPEMLRQIVSDRPFDGFTLQQWFDKLERSTQENLTGAVQRGIAQGETVNQIMQRVRGTRANGFTDGVLQTTRRQAETVTRSAVQHVSNQARTELFKQNDDVVKKVQWTASLDTRTCPVCMSLDGETFPVDGGKRPPVHANCRCAVTPVMKSWRELGVDRGEIPESTRASMNGQVPETKTFGTWLQDQPDEVVEDALGKKRARLFREGNLDVKEFVNRRDQTLTLKELRQREKSAFERAGVDVQ